MEAFDAVDDATNYCRSLLLPEEVDVLDDELDKNGIMTIEAVRKFIAGNTSKESEFDHESTGLEVKLIREIDVRINYNIYVIGSSAYNREELMDAFPLEHFDKQPEDLMSQQEVAIMVNDETGRIVFTTRNRGHDEQFLEIGDRIGELMGKKPKFQVVKTALSKIFIARDDWTGFIQIAKFTKNFKQHIAPLMIGNASFQEMFGLTNQRAIADTRMKALENKIDGQLSTLKAERDQLSQSNIESTKKIMELEAKLATLELS